MKKLIMITHSSRKSGGGEDDFERLLNYLYGKYTIYTVCPLGYRLNSYSKKSTDVLVVPEYIFPFTKFSILRYVKYLLVNIRKMLILIPFILKYKDRVDNIFVNSSTCISEIFLLYLLNQKYVISIKEEIMPKFIRYFVYKLINVSNSDIIVTSDYLKKSFLKVNSKSRLRVKVIRSAIEEELASMVKNELFSDSYRNSFKILNVGSISTLKNQMMLIKALSILNCSKFLDVYFAGKLIDINYYSDLQNEISNIKSDKINIVFLGDIDKKEVFKLMKNSDCVVITSFNEGMSIVLAESLFFGIPVIATKVGVIPEVIVSEKNGFLLESFDFNELAEKLGILINDDSFRKKIKERLKGTYNNNFNLDLYCTAHEKTLFQ